MPLQNNWLNRTTKALIRNTSPRDMLARYGPPFDGKAGSNAQWIYDPDLSAVVGFPNIYWTITGDVVMLMSPAERAAVDAAILSANRDNLVAQIDELEDLLRAQTQTILDELNLHATKINEILDAADASGNYNTFKSAVAAIVDSPQRTLAQVRTSIRNKLGT